VIRDVDYDPATFIHLKENIAYSLGGHKGGTGASRDANMDLLRDEKGERVPC
jgi:hypothetical protein